MKDKSDEELVEMLVAGDSAAFSHLVRRHTTYFYRVAYRVVVSKETAEDIVQKAFLKIWEKPELWQSGKAKFKTWFYRIVVNLAIDDKRRFKSVALDFDVADKVKENDFKEQELLQKALKSIPERQRAAIMLVYFEEMKQSEAAKMLNINIKALESLLSRGKKQLREVMK